MELRVSQEYVLVMNSEELRKLNRCLRAVPETSEFHQHARDLSAELGRMRVAHGKAAWHELQKLERNLEDAPDRPRGKTLNGKILQEDQCDECGGKLVPIKNRTKKYDPEGIRPDLLCVGCGAEFGVTKADVVRIKPGTYS